VRRDDVTRYTERFWKRHINHTFSDFSVVERASSWRRSVGIPTVERTPTLTRGGTLVQRHHQRPHRTESNRPDEPHRIVLRVPSTYIILSLGREKLPELGLAATAHVGFDVVDEGNTMKFGQRRQEARTFAKTSAGV
jgi:hypothetical protein